MDWHAKLARQMLDALKCHELKNWSQCLQPITFLGDETMRRLLIVWAAAGLCTALATGCDRKAEVKEQTTVTAPGGETTTTTTRTVESSGDNPPKADGERVPAR